jgi:hypothetical protein
MKNALSFITSVIAIAQILGTAQLATAAPEDVYPKGIKVGDTFVKIFTKPNSLKTDTLVGFESCLVKSITNHVVEPTECKKIGPLDAYPLSRLKAKHDRYIQDGENASLGAAVALGAIVGVATVIAGGYAGAAVAAGTAGASAVGIDALVTGVTLPLRVLAGTAVGGGLGVAGGAGAGIGIYSIARNIPAIGEKYDRAEALDSRVLADQNFLVDNEKMQEFITSLEDALATR